MNGSTGKPGKHTGNATEPPVLNRELALFILSEEAIYKPFLTCLIGCFSWPDTQTQKHAANICATMGALIKEKTNPALFHFVGLMLQTAIQTMAQLPKEAMEVQVHFIALVKDLYDTVGRVSDVPKRVLGSIPGVDSSELKILEEILEKEMSDRDQRKAFKNFLSLHVLGQRSVRTQKGTVVLDLPEKLVVPSKSSTKSSTSTSTSDTISLESLFGDR